MARIRTIKPEFFASTQVAEVSWEARLLFIGIWVFADDAGVHPADPKRLKMQVFPGDDISLGRIDQLLDELAKACDHAGTGLVERYKVNGIGYIRVTGWQHQKIEKPTYKYPRPEGGPVQNSTTGRRMVVEESPTSRRLFDDSSATESRGEEGKGEKHTRSASEPAAGAAAAECPHAEIVALYHRILPELPQVRVWDARRQQLLRARWREAPERQSLAWWQQFFEYVRRCPFLLGQESRGGRDPFLATLEWLLTARSFARVIEGNYERKEVA